MPKKRDRRGKVARSTPQNVGPRRGNRLLYIFIMLLTALSMMALVVAGFLNYSAPTASPSAAPTVVPITTPRAMITPQLPFAVVPAEPWS